MLNELLKKIQYIDSLVFDNRRKTGVGIYKKEASFLRMELAKLMDKDEMCIDEFYLKRQYHSGLTTVAIFTKDSWERFKFYKKSRKRR